jgi:sugar lactone lactonase YvrE
VARTLEVILDGGRFFEAPRWHDGRWYVSDFGRHVVQAVDEQGSADVVLEVPEQPSGLGWLPDGSLLVVSMKDHSLIRRWPDGRVTPHADVSRFCGGFLNDMVVDRSGRAYIGNFGFALDRKSRPAPTVLVRVDLDGSSSVVADDLLFPNGTVISADGRTLAVGETFRNRYTAFTIATDGSLTDRRIWADLASAGDPPPLRPDGCALDAEGHIWSADAGSGRCYRIAQGGAIVDRIDPPAGLRFFACMLGGSDGRTLLGCAARGYYEAIESESRDAVLTVTRVDVPHSGLP